MEIKKNIHPTRHLKKSLVQVMTSSDREFLIFSKLDRLSIIKMDLEMQQEIISNVGGFCIFFVM